MEVFYSDLKIMQKRDYEIEGADFTGSYQVGDYGPDISVKLQTPTKRETITVWGEQHGTAEQVLRTPSGYFHGFTTDDQIDRVAAAAKQILRDMNRMLNQK